jgi:hypothetical protein
VVIKVEVLAIESDVLDRGSRGGDPGGGDPGGAPGRCPVLDNRVCPARYLTSLPSGNI